MKQYIVDAFTTEPFKGNPAAVCIVQDWPETALMQKIAQENNLSETAFALKQNDKYHLRWFTPKAEIDFCGHATLATAFVIANYIEPACAEIKFTTLSGEISVSVNADMFTMNFPRYRLTEIPVTEQMAAAIGVYPQAAYLDRDLLLVLNSENEVINLRPNQQLMQALDGLCLAVTAPGAKHDCVSRVFAPELNVIEDPVTGSTHCMIIPYWAARLHKNQITAYQASERGGLIQAELKDNRVYISGQAVLFATAELLV